jgi:protein CpxP
MMNTKFKSQSIVCALVAGTALMCAVSVTALADQGWRDDPAGANHEQMSNHEQMREHFREHIKARLDKLAERLEIKASQQPAWEAYAAAVESLMEQPGQKEKDGMKKEAEEDAGAMIHRRAERAAEKAKKLAGIADATDKLQGVLNDNQRKLFNHEVRRQMEHMRHMEQMGYMGHHDGDGCHGMHGGHDHMHHAETDL